METWLSSSLVRWYPRSSAGRRKTLRLEAARGEQVSFQACFRTEERVREVTATAEADGLEVQVRRVGYVPMPHLNAPWGDDPSQEERDGLGHLPGLVPDPLLPETAVKAGPFETNAFWITVRAPADARPGLRRIAVTLSAKDEEPRTLVASLRVHRGRIQPRRDFPVTHWFYADALCDWYKLEPFEEAFWPILERYLADLASHNLDVSHIPLFTPPTDGVKRPNQLLDVRRDGDSYHFDWSLVRRWVQTAQRVGITSFEWPHLFTQWGAKCAIRIYEGHGGSEKLLWDPETAGVSPTYRTFLGQFLPEFRRFLEAEGLMENSFFHLSDEPHGADHLANYRAARAMLRELAPWMKVMDALSDIAFAREGLTDIPIPLITVAPQFAAEGYPAWVYYWGGPRGRYTQRLLDTPLTKIRMFGWLAYRLKARGFLQWAYNYWYRSQTRELINPYHVNDAHYWPSWSHGDPFQVYPGANGPVDSLRWEVFAEGLQDYALLQSAGFGPDDAMLAEIKDYADFPRTEVWLRGRRSSALSALDRRR
ncbi:MAG: DUF4091 domain-containing protein [Armatimonadota bacterium]